MRTTHPTRILRRASYWMLGLALVIITGFAIQRSMTLSRRQEAAAHHRDEQELRTLVQLWEDLVRDRIASWMIDLSQADEIGPRERQLRARIPWFQALYLWQVDDQRVLYPAPLPAPDELALLAQPCLHAAHLLAITGHPTRSAQAFLGCEPGLSDAHRLLAESMAGSLFMGAHDPDRARAALERVDSVIGLPLTAVRDQGMDLGRAWSLREQGVRLFPGRTDLLQDTIQQLTELDSAAIQALLPRASRLVAAQPSGPERSRLQAALPIARHRLAGWEALADQVLTVPPPAAPEVGEPLSSLSVSQATTAGASFLLVTASLSDAHRAVTVQIDMDELLTALLESMPRAGTHSELAILDSHGQPLRGGPLAAPDQGASRIAASVPFRTLLPDLKLALVRTTPAAPTTWLLTQYLPLGLAVLLGLLAITARVRADRRQAELYDRQQAFIARVTHELKTPLAGIRVMAETLDIVGTDGKAASFPRRIVREVDRLHQRIDEVLTAARRPQVSARTPIDPPRLAAEVVTHWRARFESAGARLETDLRPCPQLAADPALLRDALNNLLDNALKYRAEGRPLVCQVRVHPGGHRTVVFEVIDNGIGVPQAMRREIFERFARVEGDGRGMAGGHGLGLAFVAEAAEAHRGHVECLDGVDGGACFRMRLHT